ncbi:hypothetical protein A2480_01060 [Candidatus Uhrbacteria bacterium RIFOXYC2_FULL_47_19]|uniref:Lipoprotein n=1 Tax=Candidatus Uhrbacteria bacterium RIFOXYC2_FULL_47_19 TaxID=1802424 RepID=A0A1F7WEP9_9BACT|nr:MAG: hypothetical protein A2480_01060 [Candidatus Uhrbacteria bacterium RIFOXYC2_FULL_47_19]
MKRAIIMAVITAIALISGGCVSSRQFAALEHQLETLANETRDLQQQIAATRSPTAPASRRPEQPVTPEVDRQVTSDPLAAVEQLSQPRQPAAPRPMPPIGGPGAYGPPQHWARAYGPPEIPGCQVGILSVSVENETGYYVQTFIDGQEVRIFGSGGDLPHLPPRQTAYACLERPGLHAIHGVVYARRGAELVEIQRFSLDRNFNGRSVRSTGRQRITINDLLLTMHSL